MYFRINVHYIVSKGGFAESNLHSDPGPARGTDSGRVMDRRSSTGKNGEAGLEVTSGRMSQQISEWETARLLWASADLACSVSLLQATVP